MRMTNDVMEEQHSYLDFVSYKHQYNSM